MSKRVRVLIAAGDAISRTRIARSLLYWGYEAVTASDGLEAWKIIQEVDAPRVALLDTDLVGLDTAELCRRLRELRGRDGFVLVLGWPHAGAEAIEAIAAGADGIVEKPVHLRELGIRLAGRPAALESHCPVCVSLAGHHSATPAVLGAARREECGQRVRALANCRRDEQGDALGSDACIPRSPHRARAEERRRSTRPGGNAVL